MSYCIRHGGSHPVVTVFGNDCPGCRHERDQERRHEELLEQTKKLHEQSERAAAERHERSERAAAERHANAVYETHQSLAANVSTTESTDTDYEPYPGQIIHNILGGAIVGSVAGIAAWLIIWCVATDSTGRSVGWLVFGCTVSAWVWPQVQARRNHERWCRRNKVQAKYEPQGLGGDLLLFVVVGFFELLFLLVVAFISILYKDYQARQPNSTTQPRTTDSRTATPISHESPVVSPSPVQMLPTSAPTARGTTPAPLDTRCDVPLDNETFDAFQRRCGGSSEPTRCDVPLDNESFDAFRQRCGGSIEPTRGLTDSAPRAAPPLGSSGARCQLIEESSFHLRPTATIDRRGSTAYHAGVSVEVQAATNVRRGRTEEMFRVRVIHDGAIGYMFLTEEERAQCGDWRDGRYTLDRN